MLGKLSTVVPLTFLEKLPATGMNALFQYQFFFIIALYLAMHFLESPLNSPNP